jgi:hypothetical protein
LLSCLGNLNQYLLELFQAESSGQTTDLITLVIRKA